ncbi:MAG: hypothetical protein K0S74_1860 [Chlamydiales bacterium]|jgi:hypothetical protein|nr:hypothetical protein [Chlamydiales bacterium]
MNYIKEINFFYDWLETNTISDSAIALWHALMHINNKAGWIPEFSVAISTLEAKTGLKKDAILRARNRLQQMERIGFRSRAGQQSAIYTIYSFETQNATLSATLSATLTATLTTTQPATQTASITKLNKTKQFNKSAPKPSFNNFANREYDADKLEEILLARSRCDFDN